MHTVTAIAHPNIALIKYWGKRDAVLNLPATHSLSITLNTLASRTSVSFSKEFITDRIYMNDAPANEVFSGRVSACLDSFRKLADVQTFASVHTSNNFPTAAGLASSASGFAALLTAANAAVESPLNLRQLALLARQASGSAGRSLFDAYVVQHRGEHEDGSDSFAEPLFSEKHWPLEVVIAITSEQKKTTGSSEGMLHTAQTAPYWQAWVDRSTEDIQVATAAIKQRDFAALTEVAEASCLGMHALMQSARPGLLYWNGATVELIHKIRQLRATGIPVFFTIDAGPQVKAVCLPSAVATVEAALTEIPGVIRVLRCQLGAGARVIDKADG